MKRYDLIVFDWDGTLMDSAASIVQSLQAACADIDVPAPGEAQAKHVIGLGLAEALRKAVPNLPSGHYQDLAERFRHHCLLRDCKLTLFPGIESLVSSLAADGYCLAVATGKSRVGLDWALEYSGLREHFHASRCADECFSKPHPQMLEELMLEFAVAPERTLMIGDTTHDLEMAVNAGVAALAVAYGAHPKERLLGHAPLACLHSVDELAAWLGANA